MITTKRYDAVVVGAGAAGMSAAATMCQAGLRVAILDREEHLGGILLQCIHNGFGLHHFGKELTGPEYAEEYITKLATLPIDTYLQSTVVEIRAEGKRKTVYACSAQHGVLELRTKAVVLAMGCRERNRGNIGIPGTRPAGVLTAGLAQRLLNIDGYIPGRKVVIVGSGDIGLIMARRLSWVGAKVCCVVEILPYPSGLTRNIVQCLQDFDIPLHLSHAVTRIVGKDRVEAVEIAPLNNGVPVGGTTRRVTCDTVLLSVGLIPENELSRKAGVHISAATGGPVVDHRLQTSVEGVFACGNVLHVHDLVDFVSEEAQRCAEHVVAYVRGTGATIDKEIDVKAGANLKYVVPNRYRPGISAKLLMRALVVSERAVLTVRQGTTVVRSRKLRHVRPAEMISLELSNEDAKRIRPESPIEVAIDV